MCDTRLFYDTSLWTLSSWIAPFIFWTFFNYVVLLIAYKRKKANQLTSAKIIHLSIPFAEMVLFGTFVFIHLPFCYIRICLWNARYFVCNILVPVFLRISRCYVIFITTVTILDTFQSLTDPLEVKWRRLFSKHKSSTIIIFTWTLSLLASIPRWFPYNEDLIKSNSTDEALRSAEITHARLFHLFVFLVEFVIPYAIMMPLSLLMVKSLIKTPPVKSTGERFHKMAIIKILVALYINFFGWFPYHIYRLHTRILPQEFDFEGTKVISHITNRIAFWLFPVNALLYWGLNPDFAETLRKVLRGSTFRSPRGEEEQSSKRQKVSTIS